MRRLMPVMLAATVAALAAAHAASRPFAMLARFDDLDGVDRDRSEAGESVVTLLPAGDRGIAVAGVTAVHAPADTLLAWTRQIAALRQGRYAPLVVRFSDPPCLADLEALTLTDGELDDLRRCRPGDCGLKLSAADMARIQRAANVYWARETFGGKPIVSVTHVMLLRRDADTGPSVLALSKQVYATHYRTGSLSLTAMTESNDQRYLVYVQRSHVDLLRGPFGGILRRAMERRILDEAPAALRMLRTRLESGDLR